jgi:predicted TIM-barrel fold metal-dependent hydrolase
MEPSSAPQPFAPVIRPRESSEAGGTPVPRVALLDFSGEDRLLFSSDHPWVQPQEILGPLRSLKLPAASEAKVLSGNARSLFQI